MKKSVTPSASDARRSSVAGSSRPAATKRPIRMTRAQQPQPTRLQIRPASHATRMRDAMRARLSDISTAGPQFGRRRASRSRLATTASTRRLRGHTK